MMITTPFERQTNEFRWISRDQLQQKWRVQYGESFSVYVTHMPDETVIVGTDANAKPGVVRVAVVREEWRDVPTVEETANSTTT